MSKKRYFYRVIKDICQEDPRYKADAYEFIMQALYFTQGKLNRQGHVSGKELLEGVREYIIEQYGPMAKVVLYHWGIYKSEDFGNIVFNMVDKKILSRTEQDSAEDFKNGYDFEAVFGNILRDIVKKENR